MSKIYEGGGDYPPLDEEYRARLKTHRKRDGERGWKYKKKKTGKNEREERRREQQGKG